MATQKAGCILINKKTKKIGLIIDKHEGKCSFPKGHLEEGETLQECAVRETKEETLRNSHIIDDKEAAIVRYITPRGEDVENHLYYAIDDGECTEKIAEEDIENLLWKDFEEVESALTFQNLKDTWNEIKDKVKTLMEE